MVPAERRTAKAPATVTAVLVPILMQDPEVLAAADWKAVATHPSGARIRSGFADGPVCERVAIVDLDVDTGRLRPPARLVPQGSRFRDVGSYDVRPPVAGRPGPTWQALRQQYTALDRLAARDYADEPFMKVSTFGTVIRTIGVLESPACIARRLAWAFPSRQLLVVPAAGERQNAFYERDSGSLRFFYFTPVGSEVRIFTALSQDVVAHETAHAVIDAVVPDLYDAITPDSLAIHEGAADIAAVMVAVLNREFAGTTAERSAAFLDDMSRSSRFSRFAEQFGTRARGSVTLRELRNDRRLGSDPADPDVVDDASPHAISEVLSGALFGVLRKTAQLYAREGAPEPFVVNDQGGRHGLGVTTVGRVASLAFKGLDWLPPGDVSLADYARAALAADRFHLPDLPAQRAWLVAELVRRGVASAEELEAADVAAELGPLDLVALCSTPAAARAFVRRHAELLGVPAGQSFERPRITLHRVRQREIRRWCNGDTMADLDRPVEPATPESAELVLIQVGWWVSEPNGFDRRFGRTREVKVGTTLAVDTAGSVRALLRGGQDAGSAQRRDAFLARQAAVGGLRPRPAAKGAGEEAGAGVRTLAGVHGTRFGGSLRTLHVAEDLP